MMNLCTVLALVALAGSARAAPAATADEASQFVSRDQCVATSAEYMSGAPMTDSVKELVTASRTFYPDISALINNGVSNTGYAATLNALGPREGCDELLEYGNSLPEKRPCFRRLMMVTENSRQIVTEIMLSKPQASMVIEAGIACCASRAGVTKPACL